MVGIALPANMTCENCKKEKKNDTFDYCIVVPGRLRGAYTGCHYKMVASALIDLVGSFSP